MPTDGARVDVQSLATQRFIAAFLDQSPRSHLLLIPVSGFLAYLWARGAGPLWPGCWLLAALAISVWRWRGTAAYVCRASPAEQPRRVANVLFANGVLYAIPTLGFGELGDFGRPALTMVLTVLGTVSIVTTSGFRRIYRAFSWPMLGAVATAWCWFGWREQSAVGGVLGLTILLYASFLEGVARHASAVFMEGCAYRFGEQQLNAELKAALSEASEANRAKTQFLAAASHDLRQPLHSISVLVAALSLRPLDGAAREIVTLLGSVNQMLSRQLDTLLDISKLDAGVVHAEFAPHRLDQIVRDHHAAIAPVAAERDIRTELDATESVWVRTDLKLLTRALSNLTDNAIKYTAQGGLVRLGLRPSEHQVWLDIHDTGIGIPLEEQERVFREFYQVGNIERDRDKGLGLGLSIVRRLCGLLHIDLSLRSEPGRGTTMTLRFDRGAPLAAVDAGAPVAAVRRGLSVLVIDDEATVRLGMRLLLEGLGCRVNLVEGVADALVAARETPFDLVLSDLRLRAGDSGLTAIEAVRGLQPGVAAALITGDTAPEQLRDLQASGLPLLFKPVSLEQLLSVMPKEAAVSAP